MIVLEAIKTLVLSVVAFLMAMFLTPLISRLLYRFHLRKQIRTSEETPIFSKLHAKKAGTPTMGGAIIWVTVLGLALSFSLVGGSLNFIDRAQTYLPIAAMAIAALLGLADDILGVFKIQMSLQLNTIRIWGLRLILVLRPDSTGEKIQSP